MAEAKGFKDRLTGTTYDLKDATAREGVATNAEAISGLDGKFEAALAPTFSTSTAYTAGQYVWYDGTLYRFTTDHAAGSWNAAQVELAVVANDLVQDVSDLKSAYVDWTNIVNNVQYYGIIGIDGGVNDVPSGTGHDRILYNNKSSSVSYKRIIYWNGSAWAYFDTKTIDDLPEGYASQDKISAVSQIGSMTKTDFDNVTGNPRIVYRNGNYNYNTGTIGSTVDISSPSVDASWQTVVIECSENDLFTITATGATAARAWAFLDSDKKVIANEASGAVTEKVIKAPENTAYLIVNNKKSVTPDAVSYYGEIVKLKLDDLDEQDEEIEESINDLSNTTDVKINSILNLLPSVNIPASPYVEIDDVEGVNIKLTFAQQEGNRVYFGGRNLCEPTEVKLGAGTSSIVSGNSYRGIIVPIKGGLVYTISRDSVSTNRFRFALTEEYPANGVSTLGEPRNADDLLAYQYDTSGHPTANYMLLYLSNNSEDLSGTDYQVEIGSKSEYEAYCGKIIVTDGTTVTETSESGIAVAWCDSGDISALYNVKSGSVIQKKIVESNTGNFSIVCAKEHRYTDGTQPVTEGYVVEERDTKQFFFTKDFSDFKYLFQPSIDTYKYAFAMLANGDMIACKFADMLNGTDKSDSHRENPYCWLASEEWAEQHEVDFGSSLKPCGWLQNSGFKLLADGYGMFGEYTRPKVATANVWKITGTPINPQNWSVKKSFEVTSVDNQTGFKHIHTVEQDCYNGTIYISTGDDNENSMIWYSTDDGTTWTHLYTSEKYCRNLALNFTDQYIYWAPDTQNPDWRYLFKAERDANGILDIANVVDYVKLSTQPVAVGQAAYGTAYIPEYNCILVLDKCDGVASAMNLDVVDLASGTLHTVAVLHPVGSSDAEIGFRTRYSEYSPKNGVVHIGFGFRVAGNIDWVNKNKGFGNVGYSNIGAGANNINNYIISVKKVGTDFVATFDTIY